MLRAASLKTNRNIRPQWCAKRWKWG